MRLLFKHTRDFLHPCLFVIALPFAKLLLIHHFYTPQDFRKGLNHYLKTFEYSAASTGWLGLVVSFHNAELWQRTNARNVSLRNSLRWPIYNINPDNKPKLSCYTPFRRSTTVSMETNISFIYLFYVSPVPLSARFSVQSCKSIMALLWGSKSIS